MKYYVLYNSDINNILSNCNCISTSLNVRCYFYTYFDGLILAPYFSTWQTTFKK
nr:MAG TPA: hypothetical protein [Caudoviricetes sp.]